MRPGDAFGIAWLAQLAVWEALAYFALAHGDTITQRVQFWRTQVPSLPAWYVLVAVILYVHFFGIPGLSHGE